jgi:glycolate oxidase iron-sulfur subunit
VKNSDYLKDLEKCVLCGNCKVYCPTYDEENSESMATRGRLVLLRDILRHKLKPTPILNDRIFSCILCEACSGLCPSGVDIIENMYYGRIALKESDKKRRYLRFLTKFFIERPSLSFSILKVLQYILSPYLSKKGFIPSRLRLPDNTFRNSHYIYKPQRRRGRVALFTGCTINFLYPHLGISLINILLKLGYEVIVPGGEVCCGVPLRALGLKEEAIEAAKKNMRIFERLKVEAVLSLCPTCILSIKKYYPKIIESGIDNAMDISSFLLGRLDLEQPSLFSQRYTNVTYHDPCHLIYGLGVKREPRELLRKIGVTTVERKEEGCCGFGGLFSLTYKDMSNSILQKQADAHLKTNANALVTACPGCMLHLSKRISSMPIFHIVELIEEAYCGADEGYG